MKLKKEFLKTQTEITAWLEDMGINNYWLAPSETYGFVVDVKEGVHLDEKNLTWIPVKFRHIFGGFGCAHNNLTSLDFAPQTVIYHFDCSDNELVSLKGCPEQVDCDFLCNGNRLTSLEFCPQNVGQNFLCSNNQIRNLIHCPKTVGGMFLCAKNPLLGDVQKINDFKEIYKIHENQMEIEKIKDEKSLLNMSVFKTPPNQSIKSYKI